MLVECRCVELGPGSRRALARASRRVALLVACLACAGLACDAPLGEVEVGYAAPAPASAPQLDPVARDEPSAVTASPETPPRTTCLKKHEVVRPSTDDGVELVADLYTTGTTGAPAVILLHMIPPQNDRANYPAGFIEALRARGLTVLNLNRRGAAGSGGVAKEAYKGDKGWLDVKAARDLLLAHPCAPPRHRVALVGASNGTTSALDFTSHALSDAATASEAGRGDAAAGVARVPQRRPLHRGPAQARRARRADADADPVRGAEGGSRGAAARRDVTSARAGPCTRPRGRATARRCSAATRGACRRSSSTWRARSCARARPSPARRREHARGRDRTRATRRAPETMYAHAAGSSV